MVGDGKNHLDTRDEAVKLFNSKYVDVLIKTTADAIVRLSCLQPSTVNKTHLKAIMYKFGCHCKQLTYRYSGEPHCCYTCHCTDCQRASGAAFTSNMIVDMSDISLASGSTSELCYQHNNDQLHVTCCRTCGTDLYLYFKTRPATATILTGTFFQQHWFSPIAHIWTQSAVSWLTLNDGLPCFEKQPDWEELISLWRHQTVLGTKMD